MRWKGKNLRPYGPIITNKQEFNYEQALKPLGEKLHEVPVWQPVLANIYKEPETGPQPTPSITPSNTPTVSITPSHTPTPSITASATNTPTPSITASPSVTPSITPSATSTPIVSPTTTTTPTPTSSPLPLGWAQADAYLEAVLQAGGSFDSSGSTVSGATRTFFNTLYTNGWQNSTTGLYPFLGGTAASHAINAINPGTNNITWSGTVTHSAVGVQGNGTDGFGNTGIQTNLLAAGTYSLSFYIRTNSARDERLAGASKDGDLYTFNPRTAAGQTVGSIRTGIANIITPAFGNSSGAVALGRPSTGQIFSYRNGSYIGGVNAGLGGDLAGIPLYIMAQNNDGTAAGFSNRVFSFAHIGNLGSSSNQTGLQNALITYQTSLARNV